MQGIILRNRMTGVLRLVVPLLVGVLVGFPRVQRLYGPMPSRMVPAQFFGMHIHYATDQTSWPHAQIGSWRLWDSGVSWSELEPSPHEWNFEKLDRLVQLASAHQTQVVLTLAYTPRWASLRPDEKSSSGRMGAAAPPRDLADWRDFIATVTARYRGKIQYYELWNEPNDPGFYSGDLKTIVQMGVDAYRIIKAIDPRAAVLSPAMMGSGPGLRMLDAYLKAGGKDTFDIVSYHFYVTPLPPEAMLSLVNKVKEVMKTNGIGRRPLWATEIGWTSPYKYDSQTSPAFVTRTYILSWASGVQRVFWYAWDNQHWSSIQMLMSDGHTENGSSVAFSNVERFMLGKKLKECKRSGTDWNCLFLDANSDKQTAVMWTEDGHVATSSIPSQDIAEVFPLTPAPLLPNANGKVAFNGQPVVIEMK